MFEYFAFVEESAAKKYRLCLVAIPVEKLAETRKTMQTLRLKGQKRIHMQKESDSRRRQILSTILGMDDWECLILESRSAHLPDTVARQHLLILASTLKIWGSISNLVIEESNDRARDKETLAWILSNSTHKIDYRFLTSSQDECLWIADALAWAFSKGGEHRVKVRERIQLIVGP
ncbi:MAG: hypothetical protein ACKOWJ_04055 [Micrococcales bacterium]